MGASGGPNIKKEGLVLNLDATNIKSFRGEETTNVLKSNGWGGDGTNQAFSVKGGVVITEKSLKYKNYDTVLWTPGTSLNCYLNGSSQIPTDQTSSVWTFSCYIKKLGGGMLRGTDNNINVYLYNMGSNLGAGVVEDVGDGWYRVSRTVIGSLNYVSLVGFYGFIANSKYYLSGWQLEGKSEPTTHTPINTTRGSSVLTNGGWVDISSKNNHVELVNGPTYKSNNNIGYISLDGVNDSLVVNQALTTSDRCTVIIWLATTDTQFLWAVGNTTSYYFGASVGGGNFYHQNSGSPTYYIDTKQVLKPIGYLDGKFHMFEAKGVNLSTWTKFGVLHYAGGAWNMNGKVAMVQVYDRILTAEESLQNYNANKSRFI